jgi:hypothetical protein
VLDSPISCVRRVRPALYRTRDFFSWTTKPRRIRQQ